MDRAVAALLAAMLVLASAGAAVGGVTPGTDERTAATTVEGISANTTNVLVLDSIEASTFARGDLVVTRAIDAQAESLVQQQARYRLSNALDAAATDDARRQIVLNATDWADQRTTTLLEDERTARQAYIAGDITAESYLATLGRLHDQAASVETTVETIRSADAGNDVRAQHLQARLQTLQSPIRAQLADAVQGAGPSASTYVTASQNGVTLTMLTGDAFVREAVRTDNLDDAVGQLGFDEAEARFGDHYPWASENKQRISMGALGPDVYVVEFTHTHGTIDASLDASTGEIFREVQTKSLGSTPTEANVWSATENVTVGVSQSYPGGPLRVNVSNETGAPIADAAVTVNGTMVGNTDADGAVWAISPAGEYPVTVTTESASVQVMVDQSRSELRPVETTTTEG